MAVRDRLHRSELAVPATNERAILKAPTLEADVVFLDLEDAVAPDDKVDARELAIAALLDLDWSGCSVAVRINGLDTHWCYRDVVEIMERAGHRIDSILVPKVGGPSDVSFVATLCAQIEQARGIAPVNLHVLVETALGMANVEAIAQAEPDRLEAMVFGVADYAASVQARTTNIGGANRDYGVLTDPDDAGGRERHWGDQWHFAISRSSPRLARTVCGRSTGRSATSPTRTATSPPRAAPPRSAATASGRSTPRRSRSRTTSSRRRPARWSVPDGSSTRWSRPRSRARAPYHSTVA